MRLRDTAIAFAALVFTYLFCIEYLSPLRLLHIPYDLDGYHYPLMDYGFQALKAGRFPQWDAATYSGISFIGNLQAAFFHPATWILYLANWRRDHLTFQSMQWFIVGHIWLTFVFGYLWFARGRKLGMLASILGAGVLAYSGYTCVEWQHLGLMAALPCFPAAALGIDVFAASHRVRALLLVAIAAALAILAGYTPISFVFAVFATSYAIFRGPRTAAGTLAALAFSVLLAMVQILPTWVLTSTKIPESRYGIGITAPLFYFSYLVPNFFNYSITAPPDLNYGKEYLYLGAPGLIGLGCFLLSWRRWREALPVLGALAVCTIFLTNPLNTIAPLVEKSTILKQVCRDYYFLAGFTASLAGLIATGLDQLLRDRSQWPKLAIPALAASALCSGWLLHLRWSEHIMIGWPSALYPAISLPVFAITALAWRSLEPGRIKSVLLAAVLLCAACEYKAFGTGKRFNAQPGAYKPVFTATSFPEIDDVAFQQMRAHAEYRVIADETFNPLWMRHAGLATPQGFDPFFPDSYHRFLEQNGAVFRGNWEYGIEPRNASLLQTLGVRYYITADGRDWYKTLLANPHYHLLSPDRFHKVFEYLDARPPYSFDGKAEKLVWTPEHRAFRLESPTGGRFTLTENLVSGWSVTLDGRPIAIELWQGTFQAVAVPPGEHRLEFRYQATGLIPGAWISAASLVALAFAFFRFQG